MVITNSYPSNADATFVQSTRKQRILNFLKPCHVQFLRPFGPVNKVQLQQQVGIHLIALAKYCMYVYLLTENTYFQKYNTNSIFFPCLSKSHGNSSHKQKVCNMSTFKHLN